MKMYMNGKLIAECAEPADVERLETTNAQLVVYIQKLEAENAALRAVLVDRTQKMLAAGLVRWVVTGDRP